MINSRREFLSLAAHTFLFSSFPTLAKSKLNKKILILVELQGANDGLNTVIPLNQDYYYRLRPTIGIEKNRILNISNNNGLHYRLKNIAKYYENGNVKIIQNLGYPHAVLSHFRSIDIWETGGDGKKQFRNGWLVDFLNTYSKKLDVDAKGMFLSAIRDNNPVIAIEHRWCHYLKDNIIPTKILPYRNTVQQINEREHNLLPDNNNKIYFTRRGCNVTIIIRRK